MDAKKTFFIYGAFMLLATFAFQIVAPAKSAMILTSMVGLIATISGLFLEKWKGAHVTGMLVIGFFCGMLLMRLPAMHLKTLDFEDKFPGFMLSFTVALVSARTLVTLLRMHLKNT